jgi:hypothetical protein
METKETTPITFRVNPEELQTIDTKAAEAGLTRADYVRSRVFAPDAGPRIAQLEKQLNELTDHLAQLAGQEETRKCSDPEHARVFGAGHCFICDLPINCKR